MCGCAGSFASSTKTRARDPGVGQGGWRGGDRTSCNSPTRQLGLAAAFGDLPGELARRTALADAQRRRGAASTALSWLLAGPQTERAAAVAHKTALPCPRRDLHSELPQRTDTSHPRVVMKLVMLYLSAALQYSKDVQAGVCVLSRREAGTDTDTGSRRAESAGGSPGSRGCRASVAARQRDVSPAGLGGPCLSASTWLRRLLLPLTAPRCAPFAATLSLPRSRCHALAATLSLPRSRCHALAAKLSLTTLSLPRSRCKRSLPAVEAPTRCRAACRWKCPRGRGS
jgi:hypothetical protein